MTTWDGQRLDPEQHMLIVGSAEAWRTQLRESWAELERSCEGHGVTRLADAQPLNPRAFSAFIEALYVLAPERVGDDLIALAGLVPVDQAVL